MQQEIISNHRVDDHGRPAGGTTAAVGMSIRWQNGPLGPTLGEQKEPNGTFVETVIDAARDRLNWYQDGEFACAENAAAIDALDEALRILHARTRDRIERGVEGTHTPSGGPCFTSYPTTRRTPHAAATS